jgi:hypothetical protein
MNTMLKKAVLLVMIIVFASGFTTIEAQFTPQSKKFGFGIMLGDPTGGSAKLMLNRENALAFSLGASYYGSPRIGVDYLWHFNAFDSDIANLYAGPGGVIGFGKSSGFWSKGRFVRTGNEVGLGARGIFGVNILPRRTPLEVFVEIGVLLGLAPDFGSAVDAAVGVRFYP